MPDIDTILDGVRIPASPYFSDGLKVKGYLGGARGAKGPSPLARDHCRGGNREMGEVERDGQLMRFHRQHGQLGARHGRVATQ
ncbi:MAG: hypothetical protein IPG92_10390 [Flavobacteriales bacterium]|nr:hypothetical protein [Flavobacteriales bacterium]